jgi:hypothetical protein
VNESSRYTVGVSINPSFWSRGLAGFADRKNNITVGTIFGLSSLRIKSQPSKEDFIIFSQREDQ